jgi:hypothetical protein
VALGLLSAPAGAASVVGADSVLSVGTAGITLHVPQDGRLAGDGFTLDVTGYRWTYQVGFGPSAKDAAPGQVLLVFGLSGSGSSIGAQLVVDGQGTPLPSSTTPNAFSVGYYLASVPVGSADVALQASADGFAQSFSFTQGHREGAQPVVLYRGQGAWREVDSITRGITSVATPDNNPYDDVPGSVVNVNITAATLTYFLPGTGTTPADPSRAWLVMAGSALPAGGSGGHQLQYQRTLPGSRVTLTLPGRSPMAASVAGQGGQDNESGNGLFGGDYYWQVPATMRSGTIRVSLPSELLARAGYYGDHFGVVHEVPVQGSVPPVPVAFPALYTPAPVTGANPPAWAPKPAAAPPSTQPNTTRPTTVHQLSGPAHKTASALGPAHSGGSSAGVLLVVIAIVVVALAAVGFLGRRRLAPALASFTTTPAQKRAADVRAFLPSPGPGSASAAAPMVEPLTPPAAGTPVADPPPPTPLPSSSPELLEPTVAVLVPVPAGPAELPEGLLWLLVLGPPAISGDRATTEELLRSELETACFLACHPGRTFGGEALRSVLGGSRDEDWSGRTIVTYVSGLRRKLGSEHVPDATGAGGYRLEKVSTDAARVKELVARAKGEQGAEQATYLAEALSLVRGAPFAGAAKGAYGWAYRTDSGPSIADDIAKVVVNAARALARLALDAGDPDLASWAAAKGVLVWQTDVKLAKLQLDAAAMSPDPSELGRMWSDMTQRFGGNNEPVPDELIDHYRKLRDR